MKKILFFTIFSLVIASCGSKQNSTSAKFKIFSGSMTDIEANNLFPGGIIISGRKTDGTQNFTLRYENNLELNLAKGNWEFGVIGWKGTNPMEGNQSCSFQTAEILSDSFTVNFNMTALNCLNLTSSDGKKFTDPLYFYNNGFKKLSVKTCSNLLVCNTQSTPYSYQVEIPAMTNGIGLNILPHGITSRCIMTGTSEITPPHGGDNGFIGMRMTTFPIPQTSFSNPSGLFVDNGNIIVVNTSHHSIRKILPDLTVTTLAGNITSNANAFGSSDGTGPSAKFRNPVGITKGISNYFIADTYNNEIREMTPAGAVTTFAGATDSGIANGAKITTAKFNAPMGIVAGSSNTLYIADTNNNCIRRIASGNVDTIAGSCGAPGGFVEGTTSARFNSPRGIAINSLKTILYIADSLNYSIRKIIIATGMVSTIAGTGVEGDVDAIGTLASFKLPTGIAMDATDNIYITDTNLQTVRMIDPSLNVTTIAGIKSQPGATNGVLGTAQLNYPYGITLDGSNIYIAERNGQKIRKISGGTVSTVAGSGTQGNSDTGATAGCTGVPTSLYFPHGDGEKIPLKAALSIKADAVDSDIARAPFNGTITDSDATHLPGLGSQHGLYFYNASSQLSQTPYANKGDYLYYNGLSWESFTETDTVKLLLQQ